MSQKCPYCSSYNTEAAIENYVGRGLVHIGRGLLTAGTMTVASIGGPTFSKVAAYSVWKNTDPGSFHGHRCCNCGKEF